MMFQAAGSGGELARAAGLQPKKAPLQGEPDAPEGADGGVHCRFAAEISRKVRQSLAPQRTVMPQGPAAGEIARPTLRPKTGGDP